MKESLTIAIPFFNEEESIPNLHNEIIDVLVQIKQDRVVDLVLVNDGSSDDTAELLKQQKQLMEAMQGMQPLIDGANGMLNKIGSSPLGKMLGVSNN